MIHTVAKVETHNHPTEISPFPGTRFKKYFIQGAASGSGGEIRDEGAVGKGSKPIAGLCGFTVSNLNIPGFLQPWETELPYLSNNCVSALEIIMSAPLGSAAFNNEFGRPSICGSFRTFLQISYIEKKKFIGYHKPIMVFQN